MATITTGHLGYVDETTFGVRVRATPVANTVTYAFGGHFEPLPLPAEKPAIIERPAFSSFDPNALLYGKKDIGFTVPYVLLEGNILYYPLGKNSDTGPDGNIYTHTMTGQEPSDGVTLPSRTLHLETDGLTTDKIFDICGCVVEQQDVGGKAGVPGVYVSDQFRAQRITDEAATHDLDGGADATQAAANYTANPVLNDATVTEEDQFRLTEVYVGATNILDDVRTWNISVKNELLINYANRSAKTDNYNKNQNVYPSSIYLQNRRYEVALSYVPTDDTIALFDKLKTSSLDTDLTLKLERTVGVEVHEIEWTFNTSECPVIDLTGIIGYTLEQEMVWTSVLQPRTLVSLVSKDEQATY